MNSGEVPRSERNCSALESSITDAEQQPCPAVAQRSSDVTVEEYADTVDLVIGKAEHLFACPGSGSRVPCKTEVCDFIAREKACVTATAAGICEHVGKFTTLSSSSHA